MLLQVLAMGFFWHRGCLFLRVGNLFSVKSGPRNNTNFFREELAMTKKVFGNLLVGGLVLGLCSTVNAGKPVDEFGIPFGNGFPSGEHFNLILHGKKADFQCPAPEFDPITGEQIFGNVINIPRVDDGLPIEIYMESGRKGPKGNTGATELEVTDWCTKSFDDSAASLRLPKNDAGYAVYARVTGKPGEDTSVIFNYPDFWYVEDDTGNDLILLGTITGNTLTQIDGDGMTVYRTESTKGNKVPKASNITDLFMWYGTICYFDPYSYDDLGNPVYSYCGEYPAIDQCELYDLCCVDAEEPFGVYEDCALFSDVAVDPELDDTFVCPDDLPLDVGAYCRTYTELEQQWIFNIADFVGLIWNIDNNGSYNIQVRFYPL